MKLEFGTAHQLEVLHDNIIHNLLIQLRNIDIKLYNYFIEKIDNGEEICEYYLRDLISARAESIAIQNIIKNKI